MQKGHCVEGCPEGVCGGSECKKFIAQRGVQRWCADGVRRGGAQRGVQRGVWRGCVEECTEGVCGGCVRTGNLLWVYVLFQKYWTTR